MKNILPRLVMQRTDPHERLQNIPQLIPPFDVIHVQVFLQGILQPLVVQGSKS